MLKEQELFLNFFKERTRDEDTETAEKLLLQSFANQATGNFNKEDFVALKEQLIPLLKPENVSEVTEAMAHFAAQLP